MRIIRITALQGFPSSSSDRRAGEQLWLVNIFQGDLQGDIVVGYLPGAFNHFPVTVMQGGKGTWEDHLASRSHVICRSVREQADASSSLTKLLTGVKDLKYPVDCFKQETRRQLLPTNSA